MTKNTLDHCRVIAFEGSPNIECDTREAIAVDETDGKLFVLRKGRKSGSIQRADLARMAREMKITFLKEPLAAVANGVVLFVSSAFQAVIGGGSGEPTYKWAQLECQESEDFAATCIPFGASLRLLDDWGLQILDAAHEHLVRSLLDDSRQEHLPEVERLCNFGLASARSRSVRERLCLRMGIALAEWADCRTPGMQGDRLSAFYTLRIKKEFEISWDSFKTLLDHIAGIIYLNAESQRHRELLKSPRASPSRTIVSSGTVSRGFYRRVWDIMQGLISARDSEIEHLSVQFAEEYAKTSGLRDTTTDELCELLSRDYQVAFTPGEDDERLMVFLSEPLAWRFPKSWKRLPDETLLMRHGSLMTRAKSRTLMAKLPQGPSRLRERMLDFEGPSSPYRIDMGLTS